MLTIISIICIFIILFIIHCGIAFSHYISYRKVDKGFGTEYRFNQGRESECYFLRVPRWVVRLLKIMEKKMEEHGR